MNDEMMVMIADMADRIEELEAENKNLRYMIVDQIDSTGDDPEIMAASRAEWAARARIAEAKLAKIKNSFKDVRELTGDSDD
jgi:hypothetical protein